MYPGAGSGNGAPTQGGGGTPSYASPGTSTTGGTPPALIKGGKPRVDPGRVALLSTYTADFRRLQLQKHRLRGGVEARVLLNLCMYFGEQYSQQSHDAIITRTSNNDEQKNKLFLIFNMIRKQTRRAIGRLCSTAPSASASPSQDSPAAYANADLVSLLVKALNHKVNERTRMWERYFWMTVGGVAIEDCAYIPNATVEPMPLYGPDGNLLWRDAATREILSQEDVEAAVAQGIAPESFVIAEESAPVGDIGSRILSPLQFFIDQSTPLITALGPGAACYSAEIKSVDWIRDQFGTDAAAEIKSPANLQIIRSRLLDRGPAMSNISLRDLIPAVTGSQGPNDPPMALVLTRYAAPSKDRPRGSQCVFVPDLILLDEQDLAYPDIPMVDYHWEPPTTSFWSGDFITDMNPAQKFLNKRMSQLGEAANAQVYELMLLGGDLAREDIPTDYPGVVENGLTPEGVAQVAIVPRGQLPSFFLDSIRLITEFLGEIGGTDVFSRKNFPGQLRGPLAVPMLQELLDSEFGPMYEHMGEQLGRAYTIRVNNVKLFYPPIRTLHYTGSRKRDEVLNFHTQDVLRAGVEYTITIERGSLIPELLALREAKVRERLNSALAVIYVNPRTGQLDPSKIAFDLKYDDERRLDRASHYRKLASDIIGRIWRGMPPPPVQPFFDHDAMMDEYEFEMSSLEFNDASPQIQRTFFTLYEQHRAALQAQAEAAQSAIEGQMMQGAVAQATQQAAAMAASHATEAAMAQVEAQADLARTQPRQLDGAMEAAAAEGGGAPGSAGGTGTPPAGAPRKRPAPSPTRRAS